MLHLLGSKALVGALVVMADVLQTLGDCSDSTIAVNKTARMPRSCTKLLRQLD